MKNFNLNIEYNKNDKKLYIAEENSSGCKYQVIDKDTFLSAMEQYYDNYIQENVVDKFYVEFEFVDSQRTYDIQSKWFDTKEQAIGWYLENFDFINTDNIIISLMKSQYNVDRDEFGDMEFVEDITKIKEYI